jgi:hypothetical protein
MKATDNSLSQKKFKKIVEKNGKFKLTKGKVVMVGVKEEDAQEA